MLTAEGQVFAMLSGGSSTNSISSAGVQPFTKRCFCKTALVLYRAEWQRNVRGMVPCAENYKTKFYILGVFPLSIPHGRTITQTWRAEEEKRWLSEKRNNGMMPDQNKTRRFHDGINNRNKRKLS
jgi:hypothetical protein